MKNFNILFLILFTTMLSANDKSYSFIGIQTGAKMSEKSNAKPLASIGLKVGQQENNMRTSLIYDYSKNSSSQLQMLMVQIDMGILKESFRHTPFKPYVGLFAGAMELKEDGFSRDRGYVYGANTGVAYILNNDFDLDLGYHFLQTNKIENLDKLHDLTLSMHYFY